jgi:hypothetical protein
MISPHFPPDSSAGTHRVRLLAPHLASHGWIPTVLTVAEQDYEGRTDPELGALVPPLLEVVRTRAVPAYVTRRFGVGDLGLRALPGLRRAAWSLHRARPFDALFITIYPTYPAVLGPMFKRRFDVPFILDYQDPWVGAWGSEVGGGNGGTLDVKSRATRAFAERLEPRVLQAADAVTAVSARTYQDAFVRTGISSHLASEIPIGWDAADVDAIARRESRTLIPNDGRINICYTGTLLPLGVATLRAVLGAARALIERNPPLADRLRFYFFGTSNQTTNRASFRMHRRSVSNTLCASILHASIISTRSRLSVRRAPCCCSAARSRITRQARCFRRSSPAARCWLCTVAKAPSSRC